MRAAILCLLLTGCTNWAWNIYAQGHECRQIDKHMWKCEKPTPQYFWVKDKEDARPEEDWPAYAREHNCVVIYGESWRCADDVSPGFWIVRDGKAVGRVPK